MKVYIDANVFIRFFIKDIKSQALQAKKLFAEIESGGKTGVVSILVLQEILWIMEDFYKIKRAIFVEQLVKLLALKQIKIKEINKQELFEILETYRKSSFDLTDIYLVCQAQQDKSKVVSFDKDIKKIL